MSWTSLAEALGSWTFNPFGFVCGLVAFDVLFTMVDFTQHLESCSHVCGCSRHPHAFMSVRLSLKQLNCGFI